MAMVSAEKRGYSALRPRNISVPSDHPMQGGGSTLRVCQLLTRTLKPKVHGQPVVDCPA
jgi:hypothetical protein